MNSFVEVMLELPKVMIITTDDNYTMWATLLETLRGKDYIEIPDMQHKPSVGTGYRIATLRAPLTGGRKDYDVVIVDSHVRAMVISYESDTEKTEKELREKRYLRMWLSAFIDVHVKPDGKAFTL